MIDSLRKENSNDRWFHAISFANKAGGIRLYSCIV